MELARSSDHRIIGGVCAGVATRFDLDPMLVRLLFVVSVALPGPTVLVYLLMWAFLPWDWEVAPESASGAVPSAPVCARDTLAA